MSGQVLITGGAGFIGYHLAKNLAVSGYIVHLVDTYARGARDSDLKILLEEFKVTLSEVDLLDREAVLNLESNYDIIVHLAAIVGVKNVLE